MPEEFKEECSWSFHPNTVLGSTLKAPDIEDGSHSIFTIGGGSNSEKKGKNGFGRPQDCFVVFQGLDGGSGNN